MNLLSKLETYIPVNEYCSKNKQIYCTSSARIFNLRYQQLILMHLFDPSIFTIYIFNHPHPPTTPPTAQASTGPRRLKSSANMQRTEPPPKRSKVGTFAATTWSTQLSRTPRLGMLRVCGLGKNGVGLGRFLRVFFLEKTEISKTKNKVLSVLQCCTKKFMKYTVWQEKRLKSPRCWESSKDFQPGMGDQKLTTCCGTLPPTKKRTTTEIMEITLILRWKLKTFWIFRVRKNWINTF